MQPLVVFGLVGAGIAAFMAYIWWCRMARREQWTTWADARGWTYNNRRDGDIADYFGFVDRLNRGDNRFAEDVLRGSWSGRDAIAFNYHYQTHSLDSDGHRDTTRHWMWVVALRLEQSFPELRISPEHIGKWFLDLFSGNDIDVESVGFSKAYQVESNDKKFANDFCNAAMVEFLSQHQDSVLEIEGPWLVTYGTRRLELETVEPVLQWLNDVRELMPDYLFRPDRRSEHR